MTKVAEMARFCSVPDVGGHNFVRSNYVCGIQWRRSPTKREMCIGANGIRRRRRSRQEAQKVKGGKNNMKPEIEEKSLC
jgi:hypothetical protein